MWFCLLSVSKNLQSREETSLPAACLSAVTIPLPSSDESGQAWEIGVWLISAVRWRPVHTTAHRSTQLRTSARCGQWSTSMSTRLRVSGTCQRSQIEAGASHCTPAHKRAHQLNMSTHTVLGASDTCQYSQVKAGAND